jgi:hypothetical protein
MTKAEDDYLAGLRRELAEVSKPERRKQIEAEIERVSPAPAKPGRPVRDQPQA